MPSAIFDLRPRAEKAEAEFARAEADLAKTREYLGEVQVTGSPTRLRHNEANQR
jgi:hypothetical protein